MSQLKLVSWNVNGLRAIAKKGFFEWLEREKPDIVGLQEIKISADQLTNDLKSPPRYHGYFSHATRKGYSGVAIFTKEKPLSIKEGLGIGRFDEEGRVLVADYGSFILANIYYPNGTANDTRLQYKLDF